MKTNPKVNMKLRSKKLFEACLFVAILIHIAIFSVFMKFDADGASLEDRDQSFETLEIPETQQQEKPPPPKAPQVPIESEDEDLLEDETIEDTEYDEFSLFDEPPPPPPPITAEEIPEFLPFEDQPKIIGGIETLFKLLQGKYPPLLKKAGLDGQVQVQILVTKEGVPTEPKILKSDNEGFNKVTIEAIMKLRFEPARQRGRAVPFRINIPVRWVLKTGIGGVR